MRLAAPNQLQAKPDVDEMGFGKFFTDHMMKVYHHRSLGGWQKPEITPLENLVLHPAAKVLHYAVEVSASERVVRWLTTAEQGDCGQSDNEKLLRQAGD